MSKTRRFDDWRCLNCGEKGPHFAGPSFGEKGFFICQKKGEKVMPAITSYVTKGKLNVHLTVELPKVEIRPIDSQGPPFYSIDLSWEDTVIQFFVANGTNYASQLGRLLIEAAEREKKEELQECQKS